MSGKGKTGPLEAGRGKYSPPANPERVTLEVLKRGDKGLLRGRIFLDGAERLFRRSWVISGAMGNPGNRPKGIEAKG